MNRQYADTQTRGRVRRQEIIAFIGSYTAQHRMSPTIKEIGVSVGLSSTSTVAAHLRILEREGVITHNPRTQRSIRLTGPSPRIAELERRLVLADKLVAAMRSGMRNCTDYPAVSEALFAYCAAAPVAEREAA